MKYSPNDFKDEREDEDVKPLVVPLTVDEHACLKRNAKDLNTTIKKLVIRCLRDAGLLHVKPTEEEVELEPLLKLGEQT